MVFIREMSFEALEDAYDFARRLAYDVAPLARLRPLDADRKPDGTPVTEIDLAVEKKIRARILADRPADEGVLGEEFGETFGDDPSQFWVVDPIDGTALLAAGQPGYVISIAYVVRGIPQVAVIHDPNTGEQWHCMAGGGAWFTRDDCPTIEIEVNGNSELRTVRAAMPTEEHYWPDVVSTVIGGHLDAAEMCSVAREAALVAHGVNDAVVFGRYSPWDIAAAALLVVEAGGAYSTLERTVRQLDRRTPGAVFSNPAIYNQVMDAIERRN